MYINYRFIYLYSMYSSYLNLRLLRRWNELPKQNQHLQCSDFQFIYFRTVTFLKVNISASTANENLFHSFLVLFQHHSTSPTFSPKFKMIIISIIIDSEVLKSKWHRMAKRFSLTVEQVPSNIDLKLLSKTLKMSIIFVFTLWNFFLHLCKQVIQDIRH